MIMDDLKEEIPFQGPALFAAAQSLPGVVVLFAMSWMDDFIFWAHFGLPRVAGISRPLRRLTWGQLISILHKSPS